MSRAKHFVVCCTALCTGIVLLFTSCAFGKIEYTAPERTAPTTVLLDDDAQVSVAAPEVLGASKLITDGNKVALYCDMEKHTISVLDKCTGYVWNSAPDENRIDPDNINKIWVRYMNSIASIRAFDSSFEEVQIERASCEDRNNETTIDVLDDGIDVGFYFFDMDIAFSVSIRLQNDVLSVSLDDDTIEERGNYRLISIELLPFFGFYNDGDEGYTLLPDGSGTLVYFENSNGAYDLPSYSLDVFSPYLLDADSYEDALENDMYSLSFPLFGIKNGENAVLVHSVTGAEDARVNIAPSGSILPFGRTSFEYWYRYSYTLPTTNIEMDTGTANSAGVKAKYVTRTEKERVHCDRRQEYVFLRGETANYSGMANAYQNYLIENQLIFQSPVTELPLNLNVLCSVSKQGVFGSQLVKMTDFDDIAEIEKVLADAGVNHVDITLLGWEKGGYGTYVNSFKTSSVLGSRSELERLADGANNYFIKFDPFISNESSPSKKNLVLSGNGTPVAGDGGKHHYYSASGMLQTLNNIGKKTAINFSLVSMANTLVRDTTKQKTKEFILDSLEQQSQNRLLSLSAPNSYALVYADRIVDLPNKSSQLRFYDEDVPFYQLVVNGLIPYTGSAVSQETTMTVNRLKMLEYGAAPCFEITYQSTVELKQSDFSAVDTVNFQKQKDTIISTIRWLRKILEPVKGHRMVYHTKLAEGVYKVEYDNHYSIYINYNEEPVSFEGVTIEALNYAVKQPENG